MHSVLNFLIFSVSSLILAVSVCKHLESFLIFVFQVKCLLIYTSGTPKFTLSKYLFTWFLINSKSCKPVTAV